MPSYEVSHTFQLVYKVTPCVALTSLQECGARSAFLIRSGLDVGAANQITLCGPHSLKYWLRATAGEGVRAKEK